MDLTPIIIPLILEKLPSILEKTVHDGYYITNKQDDTTSIEIKAGSYNVIFLSFNNIGDLQASIEYLSADSMTVNRSQTTTERISILHYIMG
jgi:hypothetical protein